MMAASSHHSEQAMKIFLYAAQVDFPTKNLTIDPTHHKFIFPSTLLFLIFRGILIPLFSFYHWQYWACQY